MQAVSSIFQKLNQGLDDVAKNYQALALDIDGTTIRNEPIHAYIGVETLRDFGVSHIDTKTPIDENWWFQHLGIGHHAVHNLITSAGHTLYRVNGHAKPEIVDADAFTIECMKRYENFLKSASEQESVAFIRPGISNLIDAFKRAGKPVIAVSSNEMPTILANIQVINLTEKFEFVVSGCMMRAQGKPSKPAPDCYLNGAGKLGICPTQMLAVEDSYTGVSAAKSAGMDVVHIRYAGQEKDARAQFHVADNADLRAAFAPNLSKQAKTEPLQLSSFRCAAPARAPR